MLETKSIEGVQDTKHRKIAMKKPYFYQFLIMVISCILVACAATPDGPDEANYARESRRNDCISEMSIRDYQVLDDANLIVTGAGRRTYHVELARRAFGLRSSFRLGFESRTGQICSGLSYVVFDDLGGLERIPIRSLSRLTPDEHDELLIRFGKKEPEVTEGPAEKDVDSAEVEELD